MRFSGNLHLGVINRSRPSTVNPRLRGDPASVFQSRALTQVVGATPGGTWGWPHCACMSPGRGLRDPSSHPCGPRGSAQPLQVRTAQVRAGGGASCGARLPSRAQGHTPYFCCEPLATRTQGRSSEYFLGRGGAGLLGAGGAPSWRPGAGVQKARGWLCRGGATGRMRRGRHSLGSEAPASLPGGCGRTHYTV